jgi:hypothetical protein
MLTKRQIEALRIMYISEKELVYERGECYVGLEKFGSRTFFALLRACAVSHDSMSAEQGSGGMEIYTINETGRELLALEGKETNGKIDMSILRKR